MLTKLMGNVLADPSIAPAAEFLEDFTAPLGLFIGIVLFAVLLGVGFFGQRMFGFIRWSLVFVVGFVLGTGLVAPILQFFAPAISGLWVGVAVGLILAVLSRFIYNIVFVAVIGFDGFNICFNALLFPGITAMTKGNYVTSLAVAFVLVIFALAIRKYFEMILTSAIGGIALAFVVKSYFYNYAALLPLDPTTSAVILGLILTVPMVIYQYKNRIRF